MNRKNLLMMAVLVALSGVAVAHAADQKAAEQKADTTARVKLDANGDGVIDKAEAAKFPHLAAQFDQLDKNKDGKLSRDERPMHARGGQGGRHDGHGFGPRGEGGFGKQSLDANGDGKITREEAKAGNDARTAAYFDRADLNKDGVIDQADHDLRKADREKQAKQRRDELFAKADANKDGKLSRAEFDAIAPMHAREGRQGPRPQPKPKAEAPKS
ncbi:MAG: EF-hand domain-containing protein [Pseudoxanthomonas sp.]